MSGYPYGYPYQGQPPPQQQEYPSYQPYGTYPPSNGFGATPPQMQQQQQQQQHYAPPTNGYYANAQSAYDYNASSIPGLGTPSNAPPPFSAPYNGSWSQGGYGTSAPQVPYHAYAPPAPPSSTPTTYPYHPTQPTVAQVPPPANPIEAAQLKIHGETASKSRSEAQTGKQPKPQDGNTEVQEEGEIDDGYFDDLYDDASKAPSVTNETGATAAKASGGMVEDSSDQEPNFYDTDMEDVSATQEPSVMHAGKKIEDSVKLQEQPDRDRSRSYSPHLSPREIRGDSSSLHGSANQSNVELETHGQRGSMAAAPSSNSIQGGASRSKNDADTATPTVAEASTLLKATSSTTFASVSEASNEAKKAILRLLPHGVKYQTFIDEGFDVAVVKDLFMQLNLPTDSANSGSLEKPATHQDKGTQPPTSQPVQQTPTDTIAKKQEERKDRIARLMAEKKAKLAAASNSAGAAVESKGGESSASAVSTPPARPPITRAEKDRLLAQKVEALRNKAREAKKLSQKPASTQTPQPDKAQIPTPPPIVSKASAQAPIAAQSNSVTPLSSASHSAVASPAASTLPSVPRAPQINQRKRPVAADFMDYPPLPVKRPSLANRQNSSLVISISDDEDDDDVEMEVDSATEDSPASLPQTLTLTRRGPSIRDFPPLSNMKNTRQVHSPVSASSSVKISNADLETKERAILEMQKKIKELEAKKQAKARSGNVTPRSPSVGGVGLPEQAAQTPVRRVVNNSEAEDKTTPSAQLLREAEAASGPLPKPTTPNPQTENARRARVPSAQLSGKSAKALEKAERLRRMQEEMQKLQAEIDQEEEDVEVEEPHMSEEAEAPVEVVGTRASQETLATKGAEPDHVAEVNYIEPSAATNEDRQTASSQTSHDTQAMEIVSPPDPSSYNATITAPSHATISMGQHATLTSAPSDVDKLPDQAADSNPSVQTREEPAVDDSSDLDDYEPPEPKTEGRVGVDSPRFSPAPAQEAHPATNQCGEMAKTAGEVLVGSSHPNDASLTHSKAAKDTAPTGQTSFAPYESPLRYYHAYRFHANYNDGVQGGLKSLTYSNRIDPNKEMCPDEWEGNDCPRGDACQFQHFQSIVAPDSEIILELGSSDEFTGEQKREFNNGLREVVSSFQKSKVRDFRTIAQAIVDFRHRFLGDPSKVLRLEGVNI